jgi:hypothetical protein
VWFRSPQHAGLAAALGIVVEDVYAKAVARAPRPLRLALPPGVRVWLPREDVFVQVHRIRTDLRRTGCGLDTRFGEVVLAGRAVELLGQACRWCWPERCGPR